jgi:hypothetical protein
MGTPLALGMPSQSPVPVGFWPALKPRSGTRAGSTARLVKLKDAADTETINAERTNVESMNFICPKNESERVLAWKRA